MTITCTSDYSDNPHDDNNWWSKAACIGADPTIFIPDINWDTGKPVVNPEAVARAFAFCDICPVTEPCLQHALQKREKGIWGRTTGNQRRKMSVDAYHRNRASN